MKRLIFLIIVLFVFNGCYNNVLINRKEETHFVGMLPITRVDNGLGNSKGEIRVDGYYNYELENKNAFLSFDTTFHSDITLFNKDTINTTTCYKSTKYQAKRSFGADITYSVNDIFGVGGQFDFVGGSFQDIIDSSEENTLTSFQGGFHCRLTYNQKLFSFGYRPELLLGFSNGEKYEINDTLESYLNEEFSKYFLSMDHSLFFRISPTKFTGFYSGVKYTFKPNGIMMDANYNANFLSFYGGVGAEIMNMISLNVFFAKPFLIDDPNIEQSPTLGFTIGFIFDTRRK